MGGSVVRLRLLGSLALAAANAAAGDWVTSAVAPPPRSDHAMAYDSARGRVVIFGGFTAGLRVWEYDGAAFLQMPPPPASLVAREGHGMAFHAGLARTVLFGGFDAGENLLDDTWEYGGAWSPGGTAPASLTARTGHAMEYDGSDVVLLGGHDGTLRNDTWLYDGQWRSGPAPPVGLAARFQHAMARDTVRGRIVLFGGEGATGFRADTWEWVGGAWSAGPSAPAALTPRWGHAMAFDPTTSRVVLFGGSDDVAPALADAWEFDGSQWTAGAAPAFSLHAQRLHAMVTASSVSAIFLFGGSRGGAGDTNDAWHYAGTWQAPGAGINSALGGVADAALVHDTGRDRLVLFGGGATRATTSTWEYDGTSFIPGPASPPRSRRAAITRWRSIRASA